jgi:hypothetical protein
MPDDPVPVRRAVIGCLVIAIVGFGLAALVRPLIFSVAPARDDAVVVVAQAPEIVDGPIRRDVLLARSYGWDGEVDAGDGRVTLPVVVSPLAGGTATAVAAASPVGDDCAVEIAADRLRDCEGRTWTFAGLPIDAADPPLQRFPVEVDAGAVIVDFTRTVDGG